MRNSQQNAQYLFWIKHTRTLFFFFSNFSSKASSPEQFIIFFFYIASFHVQRRYFRNSPTGCISFQRFVQQKIILNYSYTNRRIIYAWITHKQIFMISLTRSTINPRFTNVHFIRTSPFKRWRIAVVYIELFREYRTSEIGFHLFKNQS